MLRRTGIGLLVLGVLGMAEVLLTMFWQEPFSSFAARREQDRASQEVAALMRAPEPPSLRRQLAALTNEAERDRTRAAAFRKQLRKGKGIGRIVIPAIGVDRPFVQGTDRDDLIRGPGHYPKTDLPGEPGTIGIAGHRTTYGAPFRHIDSLRRGDRITLTMPYGTFTYRVEGTRVVTPDRTDVVNDVGYPRLVLSACTPLFSAARRIIVFARQVGPSRSSRLRSAASPGTVAELPR